MYEKGIMLTVGTLYDGTPVSYDMKKLPHLLIAGKKGKEYLSSLLLEAAMENAPSDLRLLITDLGEELNVLPHLLSPVITGENEVENALLWLTQEMDRRFRLLRDAGVYNVDTYNGKTKARLSYLIAAIGSLENTSKSAKERISMLAAKARATGIYLAVCAEAPNPKVITDVIKANVPSCATFKTETKAESRLMLDLCGAELLEENELFFLPIGRREPQLLTVSLPCKEERSGAAADICGKYPKAEEISIAPMQEKEPSLLITALKVAARQDGISIASLQRSLHLGFKKAASLMEEMEKAGYISPYEGSGQRKLIISKDELIKLTEEENI